MRPTKAKTLIPKTAELTGISEEDCKKVIDFYYKTVREHVTTLKEPFLCLEKLGKFYLLERKTAKTQSRDERLLNHFKKKLIDAEEKGNKTFKVKEVIRQLEEHLSQIDHCQEVIMNNRDKLWNTIQKRHELRKNAVCLEESKEDTTGILEQDNRAEEDISRTENKDL